MNVETLTATLEVGGLAGFRSAMAAADQVSDRVKGNLDGLAVASRVATDAVTNVKMTASQAAESEAVAGRIRSAVGAIPRAAVEASARLDEVKLGVGQAAESEAAGGRIANTLDRISRKAGEARRAVESVKLSGLLAGGGGGGVPGGAGDLLGGEGGGRNSAGVGPIGSGYGRIGVLGTAVAGAVLAGPAAAPAIVGLLASLPTLATAAAGALGVLALASQGVGKAIGGDKAAFDSLSPSAQRFVETIRSLVPYLHQLEQTAQGALFPGLEQALHSALSPPLLNAVGQAVRGFGEALGTAAEQWGRYFGSGQFVQLFGPLMQAGAKTVGTLSDTLLHLADSVGVIARAAIPFTTWITGSIDAGTRLVDTWLRAKDATGALGGAMSEAQTSLTLVAKLVESLGRVVVSLGAALYPVSKVAVADLTGALNALAGIIQRNQGVIRDIVSTALTGLVTSVKIAADGIGLFNEALKKIVGNKAETITAVAAIGAAITLAMGPEAAAIVGAITAVGLIESHWGELKHWFDDFGIWLAEKITALVGFIGDALSKIPSWLPGLGKFHSWGEQMQSWAASTGAALGQSMGDALNQSLQAKIAANDKLLMSGGGQPLITPKGAAAGGAYSASQLQALWVQAGGSKAMAPLMAQIALSESSGHAGVVNSIGAAGLWQIYNGHQPTAAQRAQLTNPLVNAKAAVAKYNSQGLAAWDASKPAWSQTAAYAAYLAGQGVTGSPWGTPPPFTKNVPKPPAPPVIPGTVTDLLNRASANASKSKQLGNAGGTAQRYLENELDELQTAQTMLEKVTGPTPAAKAEIAKQVTEIGNKIRDVQTAIKNAVLVTGDALLPQQLKAKLAGLTAKFKADSAYAQSLTGQAAENYADVLRSNLLDQESVLAREVTALKAKLAASTGRQRTAVQDELTKVQGQLSSVQQQVLSSLQSTVQTLQSRVSSLFQSVTSQLDSAFDAQTQAMIDRVAQADFQNGAQTPLEAQLAAMQAADTLKGYTDAVAAAQSAGDQAALAAAQRQLDEYNLSIAAAKERTAADADYTAKVADIQKQRAAAEATMNQQLANLGDAFVNGTGRMTDLTAIASEWGLTVSTTSIPDLNNLSTASGNLIAAFQQLADYIAKVTGQAPVKVSSGTSGGGGGAGSGGGGQGGTAYQQAVSAIEQATGKIYTHGAIPQFDQGGPTKAGLAMLHDGEYVVPRGGVLVRSGGRPGGDVHVHLNVQALDPTSVDWDRVAQQACRAFYAEFARMSSRGSTSPFKRLRS